MKRIIITAAILLTTATGYCELPLVDQLNPDPSGKDIERVFENLRQRRLQDQQQSYQDAMIRQGRENLILQKERNWMMQQQIDLERENEDGD